RLGIIRGWESNWYGSKKDFATKLIEDNKIRNYLNARINKGGISKIVIERTLGKLIVTIHTSKPGIIIGKGGGEVDRIKEELKKLTSNEDVQINILEIRRPELDETIVGDNIGIKVWICKGEVLGKRELNPNFIGGKNECGDHRDRRPGGDRDRGNDRGDRGGRGGDRDNRGGGGRRDNRR